MNNPYTHLTIFEREKIYLWSSQKISLREIARRLNRSASTISRELRRNQKNGAYSPIIAQTKYEKRKTNCGRNRCLSNPKLWQQVRHLFVDLQWSPEQISNRLKLEKHELQIGIQEVLDNYYSKAKENQKFKYLMDDILSRNNILLAYRNIKRNPGSMTPSKDKKTIEGIKNLKEEQVIARLRKMAKNYRPKVVRRKEIPKLNGKTRPLGIPSIWDRLF